MVVQSAQNVGVQKEKKCHSYNETSLVGPHRCRLRRVLDCSST